MFIFPPRSARRRLATCFAREKEEEKKKKSLHRKYSLADRTFNSDSSSNIIETMR
jgi:hypothetical protein